MTRYDEMEDGELRALHEALSVQFEQARAAGLDLNMARGKPSPEQLDLVMPMLDVLDSASPFLAQDGTDVRNYGGLAGLPEARRLMGSLVGVSAEQTIVGGNSSLTLMHDTVARGMTHGFAGCAPWSRQGEVAFLCPAPGYDRHFTICEHFGIRMLPVPMHEDGPDMDMVERLVADAQVKGMWCVPLYSNPQGYVYSDETVARIAALEPAAPDFRVFWDNAYCVHHLHDEASRQARIPNILDECAKAGNPDLVFEFCSTSKVTFPGAGISAFASSEANVAEALAAMGCQSISADKINQLRHVRFLRDADGVAELMRAHAAKLRPRFALVEKALSDKLEATGMCSWTRPQGGYFISFQAPRGCAREIVARCAEAGVKLTAAGATWPYGDDPDDSNIRLAPSFPTLDELAQAADIFTLCVRLVAIEHLLAERA